MTAEPVSPLGAGTGSSTERAALEFAGRGWFIMPAVGKRPHPQLAPQGPARAGEARGMTTPQTRLTS
jgi:hypothetical protein